VTQTDKKHLLEKLNKAQDVIEEDRWRERRAVANILFNAAKALGNGVHDLGDWNVKINGTSFTVWVGAEPQGEAVELDESGFHVALFETSPDVFRNSVVKALLTQPDQSREENQHDSI